MVGTARRRPLFEKRRLFLVEKLRKKSTPDFFFLLGFILEKINPRFFLKGFIVHVPDGEEAGVGGWGQGLRRAVSGSSDKSCSRCDTFYGLSRPGGLEGCAS